MYMTERAKLVSHLKPGLRLAERRRGTAWSEIRQARVSKALAFELQYDRFST